MPSTKVSGGRWDTEEQKITRKARQKADKDCAPPLLCILPNCQVQGLREPGQGTLRWGLSISWTWRLWYLLIKLSKGSTSQRLMPDNWVSLMTLLGSPCVISGWRTRETFKFTTQESGKAIHTARICWRSKYASVTMLGTELDTSRRQNCLWRTVGCTHTCSLQPQQQRLITLPDSGSQRVYCFLVFLLLWPKP